VNSTLRYVGCALGFGFGVVWMTKGLGAAIVCLFVAALGYGAIFAAERGRGGTSFRRAARTIEEPDFEPELYYERLEPLDDAVSPLAAEAEYGWPLEKPEIAHTPSG
jgi:hypothetical protein